MSVTVTNKRHVTSEWPIWSMLLLPKTTDWGVATPCSDNCHCKYPWFLSEACSHGGLLFIAWPTGFGMGVGRFSRLLRVVGVLTLWKAGRDKTGCIESTCEVPLATVVLWLLVPSMAVGVLIDRHNVAGQVEVMCRVIFARGDLFSEDDGVVFSPRIVEATELPL